MDDDAFFTALRPLSSPQIMSKPLPPPSAARTQSSSCLPQLDKVSPRPSSLTNSADEVPTMVGARLRSKSSIEPALSPSSPRRIIEVGPKHSSLPSLLGRIFNRPKIEYQMVAEQEDAVEDDQLKPETATDRCDIDRPITANAVSEAQQAIRRAISAMENNNEDGAFEYCTEALTVHPRFMPALAVWRCIYGSCPGKCGPVENRERTASELISRGRTATQKDKEEALEFLRSCPERRIPRLLEGMVHLMGRTCYDPQEAARSFAEAADMGNPVAMCSLANQIGSGCGCKRSLPQAVVLLEHAANVGVAMAQYKMGVCYRAGEGVEKNIDVAVKLFRGAAEQGFAPAQYEMGRLLYSGADITRNEIEARRMFRDAAIQGHKLALQAVQALGMAI